MNIDDEVMNILLAFVFTTSAIRKNEIDVFPRNLKFIFKEEDINLFGKLIKNKVKKNHFRYFGINGYHLYAEDIEKVLVNLKKYLNEYLNYRDDDIQYVYIDDIVKFATLLYELVSALNGKSNYCFGVHSVLSNVWLRMSANDFDNVYKFLERQILFARNMVKTEEKEYLCFFKGVDVCYKVSYTDVSNVANNKVSFALYSENLDVSDELCHYRNRPYLVLPEVYFQVLNEGNKKICYIYAIKDNSKERECEWNDYFEKIKDIEISNPLLMDTKKELRNKYVNYRFILALKFFIELLRKNGISDIKVPLLQIFSYDYHISKSIRCKQIIEYSKKTFPGYKNSDKFYSKYADKEDLISKNKTERLVGTFMVLEEKFGDIEILSEPFIQDENLIVKVLEPKKNHLSRR